MDPNAALKNLREALAERELADTDEISNQAAHEAADAAAALIDWLAFGGFPPKWTNTPETPLVREVSEACSRLRAMGCAVTLFYPWELGELNPRNVEDVMVREASEAISELSSEYRRMFVDLDSGTVLNGPIIPVNPDDIPDDGSDENIRQAAMQAALKMSQASSLGEQRRD